MSHDPTRTSVNTHLGGSNLEFRAPVKEGREREREREREKKKKKKKRKSASRKVAEFDRHKSRGDDN